MPPSKRAKKRAPAPKQAESYKHSESTTPMRPEVGTQTRFKKKLPPAKFRYDDSLAPAMEWDGQNAARDRGEWLLRLIEEASALPAPHHFAPARELKNSQGEVVATVTGLRDAVAQLKAIQKPFLNWSGKAERTSFDVPSLPLFIHERLSTKAILETLKGHKRDKQTDMFDLFGDPEHSLTDQTLRAYEYQDAWVNRMLLGDSLVVMNSLLRYESMGGKVQMIYMDPPYGVNFGSNFQPFVRKRDVKNGDDADMTREPEMVQAYRDTWELGLHSYLTYLRDRLLLGRELLAASGSIFVQISDENLHHVREVMDEVFGHQNFCGLITIAKTSSFAANLLSASHDYLLWYGKERSLTKYRHLWKPRVERGDSTFSWIQFEDGSFRRLTMAEQRGDDDLPAGRRFRADNIVSSGASASGSRPVQLDGKSYLPSPGTHWKTTWEGMNRLRAQDRILSVGKVLAYKRFDDDFPLMPFSDVWEDTVLGTFTDKLYVVQTSATVIQRCVLMTTDPGDLVLDPTCGSGTTAYVAEQWGGDGLPAIPVEFRSHWHGSVC